MKVLIVAIINLLSNYFYSNAQIIGMPYIKSDIYVRTPAPYPYLREADVMWSKRIWRVLDVNEKINLPYKYPLGSSETRLKSLMDVLMHAIESGSLTAYGFEDDEFTMPVTIDIIKARSGARRDTLEMVHDYPPYDPFDTVIIRTFSTDKVIGFCIKEDWFFDKQRSIMDVRIIGIAPLIYAVDETGNIREGNYKIPLFWVYFPEARKILANAEVFVRGNNAGILTFDDVFQKRLFGSYIIKESNVFDRRIEEYKKGLNALVESEKIKQDISNFEHDMWEF